MTASSQHPDEVQYIVAPHRSKRSTEASADLLQRLLQLASSPGAGVSIVRVVGSAEQPHRLVIRGAPQRVAELSAAFGGELLFEEDAPLKLS